jgi:hypothetical protein
VVSVTDPYGRILGFLDWINIDTNSTNLILILITKIIEIIIIKTKKTKLRDPGLQANYADRATAD